jgi:hypothetical protein
LFLLPSSVVINEFLVQPAFDWNGDGKIDVGDQYIEITNLSNQAISLSGWRLDILPIHPGSPGSYRFGNVTIQAGTHMVFFRSLTKLFLSNGGETIRLYSSSGQISDAFTYGVIGEPDKTWCRLPDGSNTWLFGCRPTVMEANHMSPNDIFGVAQESEWCLSNTLPVGVQISECETPGLSAWNPDLWREQPAYPKYFDEGSDVYILD